MYSCVAPAHKYLELVKDQHMHLIVATMCFENEDYFEFCKGLKDKYVILDNGAYEKGRSIDYNQLLKLAKELEVDEVVVPDVKHNGIETICLGHEFSMSLSPNEEKQFRFMIVPQGKIVKEYLMCLNELVEEFWELDKLVVGYARQHFDDAYQPFRIAFVKHQPIRKQVERHILGLSSFQELTAYEDCEIRSWDSSLPFRAAVEGKNLTAKYMSTDSLDRDVTLNERQIELARHNIAFAAMWSRKQTKVQVTLETDTKPSKETKQSSLT